MNKCDDKAIKFDANKEGMIEEKNPKKLENFNYPVLVFDYKNRAEGVNAPTISALGSYQGWQEIEVTVDSGACDTVMPLSLCSDIPRHESEQQRSGLEYEVANGACIRNNWGSDVV